MIQVGEVLDKYELLERVGQGGMAIVYRGLDRSLKRVVAVKILHGHLADYQEARDRFEREAQAVAKLRHENILEIFDFAAHPHDGQPSCYIVTEFIDGHTLKQVITERAIAFPEIGAMIMLQVCRALAHAHAQKILHRDIKPENIMIRSDGVVKLMDFGISHMVDLERLTVTGQLLGSPAYMAPEHVEGRPLDYRTDVFAVGIVLYQLTAGKLPFEGKNPHEVLKRIAECKFVDPRQINTRIGNRLGRIILRAMAARPDDRYPAIGEMVVALESYLEESGLPTDKIAAELARYFDAPAAYEQALTVRLVDHLTRRGQEHLEHEDRSAALDVFDRVLTIDPKNAKVLAILDRIAARQRLKRAALAALGVVAVVGGGYAVHARMGGDPGAPDATQVAIVAPDAMPSIVPSATPDAALAPDDAPLLPASPPDAVLASAPPHDAPAMVARTVDARPMVRAIIDATPMITATVTPIHVMPAGPAAYRIGDGPWQTFDTRTTVAIAAPTTITVKKLDDCCEPEGQVVEPGKDTAFELGYLPATVTPRCDVAGVVARVTVGKREDTATIGKPYSIAFGNVTFDRREIAVDFFGTEAAPTTFKSKHVPLTVHVHQDVDVKCD